MKVIGIIGAMPTEIKLIKENIKIICEKEFAGFKFYIGKLKCIDIVLTTCGVGKVNAASCTQILIDKFEVTSIINTGIAGSLSKDLKICDIVISKNVTYHDVRKEQMKNCFPFKEQFESDDFLKEIAVKAYKRISNPTFNYSIGKIVTGETFVTDSSLRDLIIKKYTPHCVEMEGSAIGYVSSINNVPFLVIRSISDNANDDSNISYTSFEKIAANNSATLVLNILELLNESVLCS